MAGPADVLVVMAKYPAAGLVKTRLAERVGGEAACALYRAFLGDMAERLASPAWRVVWAVTPPAADLTPFVGPSAEQIDQEGSDLGERMWRCFVHLLDGGAERVVMLGADAPHVGPDAVAVAFAALDAHDAVLLPTRDGGYCLVALRAAHDIFSAVPMGTAAVYACTRERCAALGLRSLALPPSFDIDEMNDVRELARLIDAQSVGLPRTAAVLDGWRSTGLLSA